MAEWVEDLHPRAARGTPTGGQFIGKGGGGGWKLDDEDRKEIAQYQDDNKVLHAQKYPLNPTEEAALSSYMWGKAFELNEALRAGQTTDEGLVSNLDRITGRFQLPENTVLHRTIGAFNLQEPKDIFSGLKPGDVLVDRGFISTSTSALPVEVTVGGVHSTRPQMKILAPAGSHAWPTGNGMDEVILPRNSRLEYMGEDDDGSRVFRLNQEGLGREAATAPEKPVNNPLVVDVGGDAWNKQTAVRLETEYETAKPKLETTVKSLVERGASQPPPDEDEELDQENYVPEDWGMMSDDQQEQTKEKWAKSTYDQFSQDEADNWYSEYAGDEARAQVAQNFKDDPEGDDNQWVMDALNEAKDSLKESGEPDIPFDNVQLLKAIKLDYESGNGSYQIEYGQKNGVDISFDDAELKEPSNLDLSPQLPGIPAPDPSDYLTEDMRKVIADAVGNAFDKEAEKLKDKMEPPDFSDSIADYQDEYWDSVTDKEKFQYAVDYGIIEEAIKNVNAKPEPTTVTLPEHFDPLGKDDGSEDYAKTKVLARVLSVQRAADIMVERGLFLADDKADILPQISKMDRVLWDGWKGSSTGTNGVLLQAAVADELGGRLRETDTVLEARVSRNEAVRYANNYYKSLGGYEGVKAYVRAKWETTQYLLDKSNQQVLQLYRAVRIPTDELPTPILVGPKGAPQDEYQKLSNLVVNRNGAASTTTDQSVANDWGADETRVVLRLEVPRTAAVSIPAYGQNIHGEHEVIVAGTAWKKWDAWRRKAPSFASVSA